MSIRSSAVRTRPAAQKPSQVSPQTAPRLRVVEGVQTDAPRSVVPTLLVASLLILLAIVIPLIANTNMAAMAYQIRDQNIMYNAEMAHIRTLEAQLLQAESTPSLLEKAAEIGMVPAGPTAIISLEDGTVEGGAPAQ